MIRAHLGVVEALNITERRDVLGGDKVDCDTLATKTTATTYSVSMILIICVVEAWHRSVTQLIHLGESCLSRLHLHFGGLPPSEAS